MVLKFVYKVVLEILNIHFKTASMKTLTNYADPYWNPVKRAFSGFQ
jgi:hypothetical protein